MNRGPNQCELGFNRVSPHCCIGSQYIRAGLEDGSQYALAPADDQTENAASLPTTNGLNLFDLDNQGGLSAFNPPAQDSNLFATNDAGFDTFSLLPSNGLLGDSGSISFSLPQGANSDTSISDNFDTTDNTAFWPGSDSGIQDLASFAKGRPKQRRRQH